MISYKILIIIAIIIIIIFFFKNNNIKKLNIKINDNNLKLIEKKYSKKYPLNNNFFTITHYPNYNSFFLQFKNINYYVYKKNENILGTCCFTKFKNINAYYVCDLKSENKGNNLTYKFFKNFIFDKFTYKVFGVVMQPNKIIDKLKNKYYFKEYDLLNLYECNYKDILNNYILFKKYFGSINFTYGYKILNIYDDKNKLIETKKIIHLCTNNDKNYIDNLIIINNEKIKENDKIMFCLLKKHNLNKHLYKNNIFPINKMSIIGFGCNEINFNFIRTYMI